MGWRVTTPIAVARIAAARAVLDITEEVLRPFVIAFADHLGREADVDVPLSLDAMTVRVPLREPMALYTVGPLLEEAGLSGEGFDALLRVADKARTASDRPVAVAVHARRDDGLTGIHLRLDGGWTLMDVYDLLVELRLGEGAVAHWDRVSATLLAELAAFVDVGFEVRGEETVPVVRVHVPRRIPVDEVARWTGQLDHVLETLQVPEPQRAWMATLHPALCARKLNAFLWTLTVRSDGVAPGMGLTLPRVPISIVLKQGLDLHPDVDRLGLRLGALRGAFDRPDDEVSRFGLVLGGERPSGWIRV